MRPTPSTTARLAAVFFLLTIVLGGIGEAIAGRLVVSGDAAATAASIVSQPSLLRAGFAAYLIEMACQIAMTALFYDLLRPVSRSVALLAVLFALVGIAIKTFSQLFYLAPVTVLGAEYLSVFGSGQPEALALLMMELNAQGAAMALVFFGFYAILKGWLILRSTFLPRVLGVLGLLGGIGWLAFLVPPRWRRGSTDTSWPWRCSRRRRRSAGCSSTAWMWSDGRRRPAEPRNLLVMDETVRPLVRRPVNRCAASPAARRYHPRTRTGPCCA